MKCYKTRIFFLNRNKIQKKRKKKTLVKGFYTHFCIFHNTCYVRHNVKIIHTFS